MTVIKQYNSNTSQWETIVTGTPGVSTGTVVAWAGTSANVPSGWLLCNGTAVSRTTYATLYGVIGTGYGSGDGSTTFNLPDLSTNILSGTSTDGGRGNAVSKSVSTSSSTITATSALNALALNAPTASSALNSLSLNAPGVSVAVSTGGGTTGNSNVNLSHGHTYNRASTSPTAANTGATDVGIHGHDYTHNHGANASANAPTVVSSAVGTSVNAPTLSSSTVTTTGTAAAQTASITTTALYWIIKT